MTTPTSSARPSDNIVGSVDSTDFEQPHFVIADITTDDAWIAITTDNTIDLETNL